LTGECCESCWQFMCTDTGSILRARHRSGAWIRAASRARDVTIMMTRGAPWDGGVGGADHLGGTGRLARAWSRHARGHGGRRGGLCHLPHRTRPSILNKRAQTALFAGRTCGSQAGGHGSQVYISRHSHHACAEICTVRRYRARCSRAPTGMPSLCDPPAFSGGEMMAVSFKGAHFLRVGHCLP